MSIFSRPYKTDLNEDAIVQQQVDEESTVSEQQPGNEVTKTTTATTSTVPSGNADVKTDTDEHLQEGGETEKDAGQNVTGQTSQASPFLADWSKGFNNVMFGTPATDGQAAVPGAGKNIPIAQAISDYNKWAKQNNGEQLDAFSIYPMLSKYDATKSIADNEKEEKRMKRRQTWEQIGNVLSHIGNFVGTVMGAPSQTLESGTTLTERQKKLRDYTKQQRQQQAGDLLKLYYQDMADKRAAELNAANIAYKGAQTTYMGNKDAREKELNDANIALRKSQQGYQDARKETEDATREGAVELQKARTEQARAGASASRASASANNARARQINQQTNDDYTERYEQLRYEHPDEFNKAFEQEGGQDFYGSNKQASKEFKKNVVKNVERQLQQSNDNTPPSRRNQQTEENTPPSRRN